MNTTDEEITVTIPVKRAAAQHIEHLQKVLTERNKTIERLSEELAQAQAGEPNREALAREYTRGWKAASWELVTITEKAAEQLGRLRKDALDTYRKAARNDFDGPQ